MRSLRIVTALACMSLAGGCRSDQVVAPPGSAAPRKQLAVTGNPITYQSLATGYSHGELTVIGLQTGTGVPYGITQGSDGGWFPIGALPNPSDIGFSAVSTGPANSGNLQVVGFTSSGTNYLIYQGNSDGVWHWVGALPGSSSPAANFGGRGTTGWSLIDGNYPSFFFPGTTLGGTSVYWSVPWQDETPQWQSPVLLGGGAPQQWVQRFATGWDESWNHPYMIGIYSSHPGTTMSGIPRAFFEAVVLNGGGFTCPNNNPQCGKWAEDQDGQLDPQGIPFSWVTTGRGNGSNMQVIELGANDGQMYLAYDGPNRLWTWFGKLATGGFSFTSVVADTGNNHSLQVIGLDAASKQPMLEYQDTNGNWHWFGYLPDPNHVQFTSLVTGAGNSGNLQVIGLGTDGLPYLIYQSHSDGSWHWFGALPQNF